MSSSAKLESKKQDVCRCSNLISKTRQTPVWHDHCCYCSFIKSIMHFWNGHRPHGHCFRRVPQNIGHLCVLGAEPDGWPGRTSAVETAPSCSLPHEQAWEASSVLTLRHLSLLPAFKYSYSRFSREMLLQGNTSPLIALILCAWCPVFSITKDWHSSCLIGISTINFPSDTKGQVLTACLLVLTAREPSGRERNHFYL